MNGRQAELIDRYADIAHEMANHGNSAAEIHSFLIQHGLETESADDILSDIARASYAVANQRPGFYSMWIGGGLFLIGLVVTLVTWHGRGNITIPVTTMATGIIEFFRGLLKGR